MTPEAADGFAASRAAYIHIPFCSAICPYCDFAVVADRDDLALRYISAVRAEIERTGPWGPLDSVYFGGGTPSHVEPGLLGRVLEALERQHGIDSGSEISLEANPEEFDEGRARELRALGFNRVSFGAQSFEPAVLMALGRRHGPADIDRSVAAARDAGFENVSLDLIYGTPGEQEWPMSLDRAIALGPEHLSCYALTVERGTPLGRAVAAGAAAPDPDLQAEAYEAAETTLAAAGYSRYEVSNWAIPEHECRYNLTVWAQGEYLAFGNGAHGHRDGKRFRNLRRIDAYIESVEAGGSPRAGADTTSGRDAEIDRLFAGLRRSVGVVPGSGGSALLEQESGRRLTEAGVLGIEDGRLKVAKPLLGDEVLRAVLALGDLEVRENAVGADIVYSNA